MRGKSHRCLGRYLAERYMHDIPIWCSKAFLLGCIEPDRNPLTYLKGSLRYQWLRGHNYRNAYRFMRKISVRLEQKRKLNIYDYYTLGKLIHYTADAFTHAHNMDSSMDLRMHKQYEDNLQAYFLKFIAQDPQADLVIAQSVMETICTYHWEYEQREPDVQNDSQFVLTTCCCIFLILFAKPIA